MPVFGSLFAEVQGRTKDSTGMSHHNSKAFRIDRYFRRYMSHSFTSALSSDFYGYCKFVYYKCHQESRYSCFLNLQSYRLEKKIRCLELIRYLLPPNRVSLKADSQVACRAHAVPLSINNVCLPFDLHSAAVSDSHLPCHAHAML